MRARLGVQSREEMMKRLFAPGLAMLAGVAIGAAAVQGLQAQAKPPVYYVAEITVTNPDAYAKEFAPKAQALIKQHGGRFLAIGGHGAGAKGIVAFDGTPPKRAVILTWDNADQIKAWRDDPQNQALRKIGDKYATFRSFAMDGLAQ
jgi:uncharacterized protein (DUF1330 family)